LVKAYFVLFGRLDRDRQGAVPGAGDLQHEGGGRQLVFHGLADAVAIGRAAEALRLQMMTVLRQSTQAPADRLTV
jgi:hypothetical protein